MLLSNPKHFSLHLFSCYSAAIPFDYHHGSGFSDGRIKSSQLFFNCKHHIALVTISLVLRPIPNPGSPKYFLYNSTTSCTFIVYLAPSDLSAENLYFYSFHIYSGR